MHEGSFHRGGDAGNQLQWVQQPLQAHQQSLQPLQAVQPGYGAGYNQLPVMLRTYGLPDMVDHYGARVNAPRMMAAGPSAQPAQSQMMLAVHPGSNEMYYIPQPMNMMQTVVPMNMMANAQPDHMSMARMSTHSRSSLPAAQHLPGSQVVMHATGSSLVQPGFMPMAMHPGSQPKMQSVLQPRGQFGQSSNQAGQHQQQQQQQLQQPDSGKKKVQRGMEENVKRTIYVSYIDVMVSEEQLANFFSACGPVVDCRICADPNSAMRFAFLEFSDIASAQKALSMSGTILGGWPLRVQPSKTAIVPVSKDLMPRSHDELVRCSRTVYVASIDKRVEKMDLSAFFEGLCGPVAKLRLLGDATHNTRIAFVEFVSAEGALAALNCSGALLGSLPVRVSPSKTPIRSDTRGHRGGSAKHRDKDKARDRERDGTGLSSGATSQPLATRASADALGLTEQVFSAAPDGLGEASNDSSTLHVPDNLNLDAPGGLVFHVPDNLDLDSSDPAASEQLAAASAIDADGKAAADLGSDLLGVPLQATASADVRAIVSGGAMLLPLPPVSADLAPAAVAGLASDVESVGIALEAVHLGGDVDRDAE